MPTWDPQGYAACTMRAAQSPHVALLDPVSTLTWQDQHLLKTNQLSQRMTSILGQLDGRLSRLDKTIAPLGLQALSRTANSEPHRSFEQRTRRTDVYTKGAHVPDIDAVLAALVPGSASVEENDGELIFSTTSLLHADPA